MSEIDKVLSIGKLAAIADYADLVCWDMYKAAEYNKSMSKEFIGILKKNHEEINEKTLICNKTYNEAFKKLPTEDKAILDMKLESYHDYLESTGLSKRSEEELSYSELKKRSSGINSLISNEALGMLRNLAKDNADDINIRTYISAFVIIHDILKKNARVIDQLIGHNASKELMDRLFSR